LRLATKLKEAPVGTSAGGGEQSLGCGHAELGFQWRIKLSNKIPKDTF